MTDVHSLLSVSAASSCAQTDKSVQRIPDATAMRAQRMRSICDAVYTRCVSLPIIEGLALLVMLSNKSAFDSLH